MLLVVGAYPPPARVYPSPTQLARQKVIELAKTDVSQEQAKRCIAFALRHYGGPEVEEISQRLRALPTGSSVLVYRTSSKSWEGPRKLISMKAETVIVTLPRGRRMFRYTCVKTWVTLRLAEAEDDNKDD